MEKLVNIDEMRTIEKMADEQGLSYAKMMENAGLGLARLIRDGFEKTTILGLVGSGNNGGDTLVTLSSLAKSGWKACAYLVRPRPDDDPLIKWLLETGGEVFEANDDPEYSRLDEWGNSAEILLDGVLGTGIKLPLKTEVAEIFKHIQSWTSFPYIIAVDCPSGVDCDLGEAAPECIAADMTVCMAAIKQGLLRFPAYDLTGNIRVVDIGLKPDNSAWSSIKRYVIDEGDAAEIIPVRPNRSHKGTFGTATIVAGSINYTGAVLLASRAAYRMGVGLVRAAIPGAIHGALAGNLPEATWLLLPHEMGVISEDAEKVLLKNLEKKGAMLLGPGWGLEETTEKFLRRILGFEIKTAIGFAPEAEDARRKDQNLPPLIFDADALKHLSNIPEWYQKLAEDTILTPHPGEMGALTGLKVSEIEADRIAVAEKYAREWGVIVVLKGALTVVAAADGRTAVIPVATSSLAKAGTGDVLAGMITAFRAQGIPAFEAAYTAVWIHAQAGLIAGEIEGHPASVLAGDVIEAIPMVLNQLEN